MSLTILENDLLQVRILKKGAELAGIFHKQYQAEYIWQADSAFWGRHAPVLFPIVGRLKNNRYIWEEETYEMGQHGFARDMEFGIVEGGPERAVFLLTPNEASDKQYPFDFHLYIQYVLQGNTLAIEYSVENPGDLPLPFSIGAHPGFACPMEKGLHFEDYVLTFEQAETASVRLLDQGLLREDRAPYLNNEKHITLNQETFRNDALIFERLQSRFVRLSSPKGERAVTVSFEQFPYLGLWSKPKAPFVCIEPWTGYADTVDATGELQDKEAISFLDSGKTYTVQFSITVE